MKDSSPLVKPTKEKEIYSLDDKDYLLITALNDLANEIRKLRVFK